MIKYIIDILCFFTVSIVLQSLGGSALSWQYAALVFVLFAYRVNGYFYFKENKNDESR